MSRLKPSERAAQIVHHALELAASIGLAKLTRDNVAEAVGVSGPLVANYYTMDQLRHEVLALAVEREYWGVLAQGMAIKHPIIDTLDNAVKSRVIGYLVNN